MMTEYTDTNEPSFHSTPASEALVRDMRKRIEADTVERIAAWLERAAQAEAEQGMHDASNHSCGIVEAIRRGDWQTVPRSET